MRLIITRHGETIANIKRICQGHTPGELTETGIEQAKKLAERLKNRKINVIYSSDLKRAIDTAKEILKYHPEIKLNLDKRLRERNLADFEGKPFPNNWNWKKLSKKVETNELICERAKEVLDEIYKKNKNKTVLIVSHAGLTMALLNSIHNLDYSEFNKWEGIKNTSVSEFEINENNKNKSYFINCTEHLD